MLQSMTEAEQGQQEGSFRPGAEAGRAPGRHQHQKVNFEAAPADGRKGLFGSEKSAEKICPDVAGQRYPIEHALHDRQPEAAAEQCPGDQRKNQFYVFTEDAAVGVLAFLGGVIHAACSYFRQARLRSCRLAFGNIHKRRDRTI